MPKQTLTAAECKGGSQFPAYPGDAGEQEEVEQGHCPNQDQPGQPAEQKDTHSDDIIVVIVLWKDILQGYVFRIVVDVPGRASWFPLPIRLKQLPVGGISRSVNTNPSWIAGGKVPCAGPIIHHFLRGKHDSMGERGFGNEPADEDSIVCIIPGAADC